MRGCLSLKFSQTSQAVVKEGLDDTGLQKHEICIINLNFGLVVDQHDQKRWMFNVQLQCCTMGFSLSQKAPPPKKKKTRIADSTILHPTSQAR